MLLLDTNVAIFLRDGHPPTTEKLRAINDEPCLSIISRIELEGGVHHSGALEVAIRRIRLERLLRTLPVLDFDARAADAYSHILASTGFSRRKVLDRMIAAQALAEGATLITYNAADFRDVPGLTLLEW